MNDNTPMAETIDRMTRSQMKKAILNERSENIRLQRRIAEMRANYRRFIAKLKAITEENARRRQVRSHVNSPDYETASA